MQSIFELVTVLLTISIEVIEDSHASLLLTALLHLFPVVRLSLTSAEMEHVTTCWNIIDTDPPV